MKTDKEIKAEFKKKASEEPDKYYATSVLKSEGFSRKKCSSCGKHFWSTGDSGKCGDPSCSGGFRFIGSSPAKKQLDYIQLWNEFSRLFSKLGYTPIDRYPVAARWRQDTDFVQASIYDFQPHVVSGEVEAPANPLVVPQFCLRFNDIDNVGITGSHYTGFVMIGQHAFMPPEKWRQDDYFRDIHSWLSDGLGLPNDEITFHEDAWAGGGNFGPCMEFFSRGLELGNQVYMSYENTPSGYKELRLKVLDMGMGHERNAWFTSGKSTSYETTFPSVMKNLYRATGLKTDSALLQKFLPYASYLNVDEVKNIDREWEQVADKLSVNVAWLRETIEPFAALASIGEHSRTMLVAFSDGVLPSNVGGGYNLRTLVRRVLSLIEKYGWQISLHDVFRWHAAYLKPIFPELSENLDDAGKIIDVEIRKYREQKGRARKTLLREFTLPFWSMRKASRKQDELTTARLIHLYDAQGILPEVVREEARKQGISVEIPENFYARVSEKHEKNQQKFQTGKEKTLELEGIPATRALYFDDYRLDHMKGRVLKIIGRNVILDQTIFYPTSGGQVHDMGMLGGSKVVEVFKQGNVIVHVVDKPAFREGENVDGKVDRERRIQLARHHTATHIINGAARKVLGNHIWQAGAAKDVDKARLDITHYDQLAGEELKEIEELSNKIIREARPVRKSFMPRNEAEKKYGFQLYQGGAVPGKMIRVVDIKDWDVEACGGTHLDNTSEAEHIHILRSTKVQDGVIRIEFTAGKAAKDAIKGKDELVEELTRLLACEPEQIPGRIEELFGMWKQAVKKKKKIESKQLKSTKRFDGDSLEEASRILKTQKEHLPKAVERFKKELNIN